MQLCDSVLSDLPEQWSGLQAQITQPKLHGSSNACCFLLALRIIRCRNVSNISSPDTTMTTFFLKENISLPTNSSSKLYYFHKQKYLFLSSLLSPTKMYTNSVMLAYLCTQYLMAKKKSERHPQSLSPTTKNCPRSLLIFSRLLKQKAVKIVHQ